MVHMGGWKSSDCNYEAVGPAMALPIVLIHGFPFSRAMWRPQVEALKKEFRVISYDIRGHGRSPVGDGLFTIELFVDDLLGLLDELNISRAVLCGLSMGGYIALRAAERAPERLAGLILADTRSEADANAAKVLRAGAIQSIAEKGPGPFAEEFVKGLFSKGTLAASRPCVEVIMRIMNGNSGLGMRGTLLALSARPDMTAFLPSIRVPTLVIVGEEDALTPPALSQAMAKAVPGAELAVIAGAGHLSSLENPEAFNARLLSFLQARF